MPGPGMDPAMAMDMPLLPGWLRVLWALDLGVVVMMHLWHVWWMSGRTRWWHAAHVVMAAGMMVMYLLAQPAYAGLYRAGVALFGVLTITMIVAGVWWSSRDKLLNGLWAASTVDMLVMTYMSLPAGARAAAVTYLLVVYLAGAALAWVCNPFRFVARGRGGRLPRMRVARAGARRAGARRAGAALLSGPPRSGDGTSCPGHKRLVADVTPAVRVSLAVMALGMGYMCMVAMQTMHMHVIPAVMTMH